MLRTFVGRLRHCAGAIAFFGAAAVSLLALWLVAEAGVGGPASAAPDGANAVPLRPVGVVPGQYIVVFKDDVADPRAAAGRLARTHGFEPRFIYTEALKGFSAALPLRAVAALSRNPRVAYIEADQWVQAFAQTVPTGVQRIFADENTKITIDGKDDLRIDVDVAVIDTGIDFDHPDLYVVARADCTGGPFNTNCADDSGNDGNGHGTHVAGTIGALDNEFGVVGVAPGARLWAVKVLKNNGSGWISNIIGGIDYVTGNAGEIEVANMSLGCECSSAAMDQAITNSVAAGVVYVVAAGNSDKDASTFSPANHPDVITVSALADFNGLAGGGGASTCRTDVDDTLADFSNWGSLVEVAAPGVCILSTWNGDGYNTISGTSMASPHIAGAAALLASGANDPMNKADVDAIIATIIANGNDDWTDDSGDGIKEPLLDVSNTTVFNPATVAGGGGAPAPVDSSPSVSWANPLGGDTVTESVTIQIDATDIEDDDTMLTVEWRVDGGTWQTATYIGPYYEASWDTTGVADGGHTLGAQATDNVPQTGVEAAVTVTVDNGGGGTATVSSADVAYATEGGKNKDKHLNITVTVVDDLGNLVSGASVSILLERDLGGSWSGTGTTGPDGTVTFTLKNAPSGCYTTDVSADGTPLDPTVVQDGTTDSGFCK